MRLFFQEYSVQMHVELCWHTNYRSKKQHFALLEGNPSKRTQTEDKGAIIAVYFIEMQA
jgi:hypothetical protein